MRPLPANTPSPRRQSRNCRPISVCAGRSRCSGRSLTILLRWLSGAGRWSWPIAYSSYDDLAKSWDGFFAAVAGNTSSRAAEFNGRVRSILLPRSIWADTLAWYYGHLYRSAYVSIFILAGLSVPIGLCYLFFLESPAILDYAPGLIMPARGRSRSHPG